MNIELRQWLKDHFERHAIVSTTDEVVMATENQILIDDLSDAVLNETAESGRMLMKLSWFKALNWTYHYDLAKGQLNLVGADQFVTIMEDGSVTWNGIAVEEMVHMQLINGERYLAMDEWENIDLEHALNMTIHYDSEKHMLIYRIGAANSVLTSGKGIFKALDDMDTYVDVVEEMTNLKALFSGPDFVENIEIGQNVYAEAIDDTIAMVITASGNLGYVPLDSVAFYEAAAEGSGHTTTDEPVHMIWEYVYKRNPNVNTITNLVGINVVSPTWYELEDAAGNFGDKSGAAYTSWAKEQGYEIWPLITNSFDPDLTHTFLESADSRMHFIEQIVEASVGNGYDGINIDFENIYLEDRDALSNFINELAWYLKPLGIKLSMDVTVIAESDNWSKCFDRETLGRIVDYLVVMTYDEYWSSSPVSGPVASYDWAERSLRQIAELVPSEKIIMGIPLYTRIWSEAPNAEAVNQMSVSSTAIGIASQDTLIEEMGLSPTWSETDRLYFVSYVEGDLIQKIWVENVETIAQKIELSKSLSLGGYAFWRRGFEADDFFNALQARLEAK
jgi:spore germination protein YaaH